MPDPELTGEHPAMLEQLLARCRFPNPDDVRQVTCAVSGGADSLALLVLACAAGFEVTAIHVDHGLRSGSATESTLVAEAAERFGASFRSVTLSVGHGPNLEARARAARYEVLPPGVLTGHTADDQAETILLNLMRGSGIDGLAGMRPTQTGPGPVRPLLGLRRRETVALCRALELAPLADPSNDDLSHRRNRVRHQLVPLLDAIAERDVVDVLSRQASALRDEADLLDELAGQLDPTDARALAAAPVALARRAVRRWLGAGSRHPPDAATVARVLEVARGANVACEVAGGRRVERHGGRMSIVEPPR